MVRATRHAAICVSVGVTLLPVAAAAQWAEPIDDQKALYADAAASNAAYADGAAPAVAPVSVAEPSPADINPPPPPPAFADTVLPTLGTDPSAGDIRAQLLDAFGDTRPPVPADRLGSGWQIIPILTVAEEWTDNAGLAAGSGAFVNDHAGSDFVTLIEPDITLLGDTERLQVTLHYAPIGEIFAENGSFSQIRQNANGDVLATLLPDWLYFDVRGAVAQQPVFGGLGFFNAVSLAPNERETVSSVSASPYISHTFGGTGTLQAGVGYLYSAVDAPNYLNTPGDVVPIATSYDYGSSWLATRRAFASFTTGEDFQRLQDRIGVDASFYDGSGELRDGRRVLVTDDASYALNRYVSLLGQIGFEDADYPQGGFRYVGPVGAAGVRLTPSRNSSLTAEYRYIDGFGSPYVYGSWQVTPHIRVFGGYSEAIASYDQDQQDLLLAGNLDPSGVLASGVVAAPLLGTTGLFAGNQALSRYRRLDATAAYVGDRDILTASFYWQRSTIVGNPYGLPTSVLERIGLGNAALTEFGLLAGTSSTTYTGAVDWQHDLQPDLSSNLYAGYTSSTNAAVIADKSAAVLVSARLTKFFSASLSGALTYAGTYFVEGEQFDDFNRNTNTVTVSVTKRF